MYAKSYWASMLTRFCFCVKLRFFFFMESIKSPYNDKFEIRGFMTITRIPKTLFIQIKDGVTYLMVINQLHKVLCISSDMIQWNTSIGKRIVKLCLLIAWKMYILLSFWDYIIQFMGIRVWNHSLPEQLYCVEKWG